MWVEAVKEELNKLLIVVLDCIDKNIQAITVEHIESCTVTHQIAQRDNQFILAKAIVTDVIDQ